MISIIIPIYNSETRLRRCLDSILTQDYNDFECILVDDGSDDQSPQIIDGYVEKDSRFKAIHKTNRGVSSARNEGLSIAKGEWVVFVDSDDYILHNHLSSMLKVADNNIDIILTGFEFLHPQETTNHSYNYNNYVGRDKIHGFIFNSDFLNYQIPWDRMYRRSIVTQNNITFNESLSFSEDRLFCYNFLCFCNGVSTIDKITYIHDGTDETTLSFRKYSSKMNERRLESFKIVLANLSSLYVNDDEERHYLEKYLDNIYTDLINAYKNEGKMFQYYKARALHKLNLL